MPSIPSDPNMPLTLTIFINQSVRVVDMSATLTSSLNGSVELELLELRIARSRKLCSLVKLTCLDFFDSSCADRSRKWVKASP